MKNRIILRTMLGTIFFVIGFIALEIPAASAATAIYRSVGPNATSYLARGSSPSNSLTISGSTATFGTALSGSIGVGDALQYDDDDDSDIDANDSIVFIHGRNCSTTTCNSFTVKKADGTDPVAVSGDTNWSIYRAYIWLSYAESGVENTAIDSDLRNFDDWTPGGDASINDQGKDLTGATDQQWNIACYDNPGIADMYSATFDGWTTDPDNYINIYTPYAASDVGTSQRHSGLWSSKYNLSNGSSSALLINEDYVRVEGLQIELTNSVTDSRNAIEITLATAADIQISHNIFRADTGSATYIRGVYVDDVTPNTEAAAKIWNNIFYDWTGGSYDAAIRVEDGYVYAYSNTIQGSRTGISVAAGTVVAKNNLLQNCTDSFSGTFDTGSTNNNTDQNVQEGAFGTSADTGTTDGIELSTNKLRDTGHGFDMLVKTGMVVHNTTDNTYSFVTAVNSATELTLNDDIMDDSENYVIYNNTYGDVAFIDDDSTNDFHLNESGNISAVQSKGATLTGDPNLAFINDIDRQGRSGAWDIGADEIPGADQTLPVVTQVTPITTPDNDQTPSYTFHSTEEGYLFLSGGCSATTSPYIFAGNNTIELDFLAEGTYSGCTLKVRDNGMNESNILAITPFTIDVTAPIVNITNPTSGESVEGTEVITFTDSETTSPQCSVNGSDWTNCTTGVTTLSQITGWSGIITGNTFTFQVRDTDAAGNAGTDSEANITKADLTAPVIAQVTAVNTPFNNPNPSYTFSSTEAGTIAYGGSCSASDTTADADSNTITFNTLAEGTYSDCTIIVTDASSNPSNQLTVNTFVIDTTAPVVSLTTPATGGSIVGGSAIEFTDNDQTDPECSFDNSTWTNCTSGATLIANITGWDSIAEGATFTLYLRDTDAANNVGTDSSTSVTKLDGTAPVLTQVTAVSSPTNDTTPNYTFSSTEAGTITYGGSCSSSDTTADAGSNTISFSALTEGAYSNCTITVTDAAYNASAALSVAAFTIDTTAPTLSAGSPSSALAFGTTQATLSLTTSENSTCKYSTSASTAYASMGGSFSTTGGTSHSTTVSSLSPGSFTFYVRCQDSATNSTATDYPIAFSIAAPEYPAYLNNSYLPVITIGNNSHVWLQTKASFKSRSKRFILEGRKDDLAGGYVKIYFKAKPKDKKKALKATVTLDIAGKWTATLTAKQFKKPNYYYFDYYNSSSQLVSQINKKITIRKK